MTSVTVQAPAKINLSLAVGSPRADGYHPLATVYQAVSLFDHVTAAPAPDGEITLEPDRSSPVCAEDLAALPADGRNLAVRAARLLAEHTGTAAGVHLGLRKAIPVAAGLAGGSADAAAALVACNHLWGTGLSRADLLRLGADLGSDVPFCLVGGTAVGYGRGERVSPVLARGSYHWVLALARHGLSTPEVYAELDRLRAASEHDGTAHLTDVAVPDELFNALRANDLRALGRALCNDLEAPATALRPDLLEVLQLRVSVGAHGSLVSGSGPTCLFLAEDAEDSNRMRLRLTGRGVYAAHAVAGPVPGARVVSS